MVSAHDRGIWAIWYELDDADWPAYGAWFHGTHIPEKLLRPGYAWAAHYRLEQGRGYLALFGGITAHTFLDPSPLQLAARQSDATRRFVAMRRNASVLVLCEETRVDGPDVRLRGADETPGPVIQFGNYNAATPAVEDDLGAWYAQERLPLLATLPGCVGARKMLASVGEHKHAILHEFASLELREHHFGPHEAAGARSGHVDGPRAAAARTCPTLARCRNTNLSAAFVNPQVAANAYAELIART